MNPNILTQMNSGCDCTPTTFKQKGEGIEAREYRKDAVSLARLSVLQSHPLLAGNYVKTVDGIIDGVEYTREEMKIIAKSLATGGRGIDECGFIPSDIEVRRMKKYQDTKLIHIDHENCPYNFIGTTYQDVIFGNDRSQQRPLYGSDKLVKAMMEAMQRAMRTISVGIHKGSDAETAHFDGILAQIVRNEGGVYFETVKYDFSSFTVDAVTPLFVKHGGETKTFTSISDFADWLALVCDITGGLVYTVIYDGVDGVQVTANKAGYTVGVEVVAGETEVDWKCASVLEAEIVQNRMPFPDSSSKIPFRAITAANFHEEMNLVIEANELSKQTQYTEKQGAKYMAIDPLIINLTQKMANYEMNTNGCCNVGNPYAANNWYDWTFVPLEELRGTGLYWMANAGDFHFLTDVLREGLSGMRIGVDAKCENVWMKFDQLANVIGMEFNGVVSNVCGSPFAAKVLETEANEPRNIPALCPETRATCLKPTTNDTANFIFDAADLTNFAYESTTIPPYGLTVASYAWEVMGASGATATLAATQTGLADVSNATLGFDALILKLTITFSDGSTDVVLKPLA